MPRTPIRGRTGRSLGCSTALLVAGVALMVVPFRTGGDALGLRNSRRVWPSRYVVANMISCQERITIITGFFLLEQGHAVSGHNHSRRPSRYMVVDVNCSPGRSTV